MAASAARRAGECPTTKAANNMDFEANHPYLRLKFEQPNTAGKPPGYLKQIKVKCGVCTRMGKEVAYYQKESVENEARVQVGDPSLSHTVARTPILAFTPTMATIFPQGMKDAGKDKYDIKKAEEVLQERLVRTPWQLSQLVTQNNAHYSPRTSYNQTLR